MPTSAHLTGAVAALVAVFAIRHIIKTQRHRSTRWSRPHARETVYRARAKVCAVARRSEPLDELAKDCGDRCLPFVGDFTDAADMEKLRGQLLRQWDGLDTLHICAGVSAVQPVMALTGIKSSDEDPNVAGVQRAAEIASRATQGNFFGPFIAAVTFIPMIRRTSASPAILLVSSVAAIVPAPTRALYAATKAASLLLFQSLAIEHPEIAFTCVLPATIEGNFRSSAVDADPSEKVDETNKKGLKLEYVASRCAEAVDQGLRGNVVIPWIPYAIAHHLYYIWPLFIERQARKKYNFTA